MPGRPAQTEQQRARLALLYRIPAVPARGRLLELSAGGESMFGVQGWQGELAEIRRPDDVSDSAPLPEAAYDLVILHGTLDDLWRAATPRERAGLVSRALARAAAALAPGGVVAGCVHNRLFLNDLLRDPLRAFPALRASHPLSVAACRRELSAAGFEDLRLFSMLPGLEAPQRLAGIEQGWSRRACRLQLEAMRPLVGPAAYALWRGLAWLGVSQHLGAATFFWGRRAC